MLDNLIGLLLLGLGVNNTFYAPNPNVKGDETVASAIAVQRGKTSFRLNPKDFENDQGRIGSKAANTTAFRKFDAHAFGLGVLKMQEDFADRVEASREASQKEFEDNKTRFQQGLALIKDTKKQAVVQKLNANCQDINSKRTDKMKTMLEKLSLILTNVTNKAANVSSAGKDTTAVDTAVTAAQLALADAQSAVASQASETCTITITSETNLRTDVGKVISGLQASLKSSYDKVLAARKAVSDAIRALATVTGESLTGVGVPSSSATHATASGGTQQ